MICECRACQLSGLLYSAVLPVKSAAFGVAGPMLPTCLILTFGFDSIIISLQLYVLFMYMWTCHERKRKRTEQGEGMGTSDKGRIS